MAVIDPGAMRTELALEECLLSDDGLGGHTESWEEIGLVFGMVEPLRADNRFAAGQSQEEVTHRVSIRWRANVSSGMRLTRGARVLDILTVHDPDESGRYLVCRCREKGA